LAEKLKKEMEAQRVSGNSEEDQPITAVEAGILSIWQQVLGMQQIGTRDDFLAMGGDSSRPLVSFCK